MFINVEKRLNNALSALLEPGEEVVSTAFGLHTVSQSTARWIMALGMVVGGLFLLAMINDKVFVVLTNRRLLIIKLTMKGLYRCGQISLPLGGIARVQRDRGSLYQNLEFLADGRLYRFKLCHTVINLPNNGARAIHLADNLYILAQQNSLSSFPTDAGKLVGQPEQDRQAQQVGAAMTNLATASRHKRLPLVAPLVGSTLLAIPMAFMAMCAVFLTAAFCIEDTAAMSDTTTLLIAFCAFVIPALEALAFIAGSVYWVRHRAQARVSREMESAEAAFDEAIESVKPMTMECSVY